MHDLIGKEKYWLAILIVLCKNRFTENTKETACIFFRTNFKHQISNLKERNQKRRISKIQKEMISDGNNGLQLQPFL